MSDGKGKAMNCKQGMIGSLLGLSVAAMLTVPCSAQQTYRLLNKEAAGDVRQSTEDLTMSLTLKVKSGGHTTPFKYATNDLEKARTEVLAVDAAGNATDLRRAYSIYIHRENGTEGSKNTTSSLQGRTIHIQRKNGKVVVESEDGPIEESDRQSLMSALDTEVKYYPDRALALGEEWTPDSAGVAHAFKGAKNLILRGKLIDIVPFAGHQCAHVHWKMSADLPDKEYTLHMKLDGDSYQALDIQRMLSLVFTGPLTMTGKTTTNGKPVTLDGTGAALLKMSSEWTMAEGKSSSPAVQPAAAP